MDQQRNCLKSEKTVYQEQLKKLASVAELANLVRMNIELVKYASCFS
jgi:hypothetical protein